MPAHRTGRGRTARPREDRHPRHRGPTGPFKGALEVAADGTGRSPTAAAVTILTLVLAAGLSSAAISLACWLARAPGLLIGAASFIAYAGVLATSLTLVFGKDKLSSADTLPATFAAEEPGGERRHVSRYGHRMVAGEDRPA